jgi:hypothetical protein
MMSELTLAEVLETQERRKEWVREELVQRAGRLRDIVDLLARKLTAQDDAHINSLGECQMESQAVDRLCALYMEKRDLIRELKGESLI